MVIGWTPPGWWRRDQPGIEQAELGELVTGSAMLQVPKERNAHAGGWRRRRRSRRAGTPRGRCRRARRADRATSATSAPSRAASTAASRLTKPCCSKPVAGSVLRSAWCRPAVALNGTPARTVATTVSASSVVVRVQVGAHPAGAQLRPVPRPGQRLDHVGTPRVARDLHDDRDARVPVPSASTSAAPPRRARSPRPARPPHRSTRTAGDRGRSGQRRGQGLQRRHGQRDLEGARRLVGEQPAAGRRGVPRR